MTDYTALVNRGTTDFKLKFAPGSPLLADEGDAVSMTGTVGITTQLQWRVWLPPGTRCLQSTLFTNASPPESKALMRMGSPPTGTVADVTPENAAAIDRAAVLSLLQQGAEIPCYTPASAGSMKLSDGRMDSPIVITTGAWLYINALQVPGIPPQIFELTAYVKTDKAQYLDWYAGATWDAEGNPVAAPPEPYEQRLLQCAIDTGLVDGLRKLSGGLDDDALIAAVQETGTWPALMKFAQCCPRS
jgi:hypothetical protein